MLRIALLAVSGLLALAVPASAQPLENTMISGYAVHAAMAGTQVGSEGFAHIAGTSSRTP
ncbi:hypothetical protein [Solirubrobacter soli]|uniref:hypothetical protein n=1 Tax=Solirubrobacter soli TaxID=363832 RepID=UPI0004017503|nr:hypothetical protein [Solirubrobacter soli]